MTRAHESVLVLVAPNARRVEIVMGTSLRGRLSDRDCALAALSMTSSFSGGDLAGGVLQGVRMLGQRTAAPRRLSRTRGLARQPAGVLDPSRAGAGDAVLALDQQPAQGRRQVGGLGEVGVGAVERRLLDQGPG